MKSSDQQPKHICNECEHMKRTASLFSEYEIVECSKYVYRTLNIIPQGGGIEV